MFTTFIIQPIFNILVFIYAMLPGHNFGLALIIFTVVVRLALWPLVKRQLHQAKMMRQLQPELKAIKKKARGNRTKESQMVMELYKEREISPFGPILIMIPQLIILIGLYNGLNRVVHNPQQIITFAYPFLQHFSWMKHLAGNIHQFDNTLFGLVDLTRPASGAKGLYWPAVLIVLASSLVQYYQSKQLLPDAKNARKLRDILKASSSGEQVDQSEVQAATSRSMLWLMPALIFFMAVGLPSAIGLYWLVGSIVAIIQQAIVLRDGEAELEAAADKTETTGKKRNLRDIPEAEVVAEAPVATKSAKTTPTKSKKTASSNAKKAKRRKK